MLSGGRGDGVSLDPDRRNLMARGLNRSTDGVEGIDYGLREFQNAVATLLNVFYLLELEASNPEHVRRYLKLTDPAMECLLKILKERLESA